MSYKDGGRQHIVVNVGKETKRNSISYTCIAPGLDESTSTTCKTK